MSSKLCQHNAVGVPEALPNFYMVLRTELRTSDGEALRLVRGKPIIHWPSRMVIYNREEAERTADRLAARTPGFTYVVIGPAGYEAVVSDDEKGDDLL